MIFNSFEFLLFFIVVFFFYYFTIGKIRLGVLLISGAFFMAYHVPSFFVAILPIILLNYFSGIAIEKTVDEKKKKTVLILAIILNVLFLIFFKYINFIFENINSLSGFFHSSLHLNALSILLPLGISFYIFQALSYNLDVYWEMAESEKNIGNFAAYFLFFPKIISGPIERAHVFIPQIKEAINSKINYSEVKAGLQLTLWGLFKKLVIADRIDPITNLVFNNVNDYHGLAILIGTGLYVIQLYADFSGYTDMALGLARVLGFRLTDNFNRPFTATSISEFWRRWHISLSSWVTDYIYTPVSINKRHWKKYGTLYALFLTFIILGFWHGATWNFIIYGFFHALAVSYEYLTKELRTGWSKRIPKMIYNPVSRFFTIAYLGFTMLFFRFSTTEMSVQAIKNIFNEFSFSIHGLHLGVGLKDVLIIISGIFFIEFVERLIQKHGEIGTILVNKPTWQRWSVYYFFILAIMLFGCFGVSQFIYFQF